MLRTDDRPPAGLLEKSEQFARKFDREPFAFDHALADHPLFAPEHLLELAKEMARDKRDVYYDAGDVRVDQRWDQTPVCDLPIDELFERIESRRAPGSSCGKADKHPEFAAISTDCMGQIEALSGPRPPPDGETAQTRSSSSTRRTASAPITSIANAMFCCRSAAPRRSAFSTATTARCSPRKRSSASGRSTTTRPCTSRTSRTGHASSNCRPAAACTSPSTRRIGYETARRSPSRSASTSTITMRCSRTSTARTTGCASSACAPRPRASLRCATRSRAPSTVRCARCRPALRRLVTR